MNVNTGSESKKERLPPFRVVLSRPEIPQNTGNIGRLCVSTGTELHLVEPLGFSLDDRYIKRAGLDYWPKLNPSTHSSWDAFCESRDPNAKTFFFSTKATKLFWDCPMAPGDYLVFGNESSGLPPEFYDDYKDELYALPMPGEFNRSLNLANTVAVVVYEGLRRLRDSME